jgi:hypothetical protein
MIPKKPVPDLVRDVQRFSEKIMLNLEEGADVSEYAPRWQADTLR